MPDDIARTVAEAITSRHSVRAYLDRPVPRATIEAILRIAAQAPSGSNIQPWRVHVLAGAALDRLRGAMKDAFLAGEPHEREYKYYTEPVFEPYLTRQRACGWGLYGMLGIGRGDREKSRAYRATNYEFFGAPVGMVFTIDRRLELGSWLDYGMFLQSIMVAARGFGLHSCAEASIAEFHPIIREQLAVPEGEMVICGIALGYADPDAIINGFRTTREPVESFTTFHD
ncbi:MAG TPA: nitroreductase [Stellaceae bacterium]|jgi:nitroreductase|nr:nitroreductase [Stellaceae bacterium]